MPHQCAGICVALDLPVWVLLLIHFVLWLFALKENFPVALGLAFSNVLHMCPRRTRIYAICASGGRFHQSLGLSASRALAVWMPARTSSVSGISCLMKGPSCLSCLMEGAGVLLTDTMLLCSDTLCLK